MTDHSTARRRHIPFGVAFKRLQERFPDLTEHEVGVWTIPDIRYRHAPPRDPIEEGELAGYTKRGWGGRPDYIGHRMRFRLDDEWEKQDPRKTSWDFAVVLSGAWFKEDDVDRFVPKERWLTYHQVQKRWQKFMGHDQIRAVIHSLVSEGSLFATHPYTGYVREFVAERVKDADPSAWAPMEYAMFPLADIETIEADHFRKKIKPRPKNISERRRRWQAAVDEYARQTPGRPHREICQALSKKLGAEAETIRRRTRKPK